MKSPVFLNRAGQPAALPVMIAVFVLAALVWTIATFLAVEWSGVRWPLVLFGPLVLAPLVYGLVVRPLGDFMVAQAQAANLDRASASVVDDLTRTLNRRGITSSLLEAMAQSQRYSTPLSVLAVHLDHIEDLASRYGEAVESKVLEVTSATLGESLRLPDRLGRYHAHEFLVVLPQTVAEHAVKVGERLCRAIEKADFPFDDAGGHLTVSVGLADFGRGQDLERFLGNAHKALRDAQAAGGNCVVSYKPPRAKNG